jgi:hypothetical protein
MASKPHGWHWPARSDKFHYFNGQDRSLCRKKLATPGKPFYSGDAGDAIPFWWPKVHFSNSDEYKDQCGKCRELLHAL